MKSSAAATFLGADAGEPATSDVHVACHPVQGQEADPS
jgi:hypothetical protein